MVLALSDILILAEFGHSDRNGGILCKKRKNSAKIGMVGSYGIGTTTIATAATTGKIVLSQCLVPQSGIASPWFSNHFQEPTFKHSFYNLNLCNLALLWLGALLSSPP